jgi:hypothetical protein
LKANVEAALAVKGLRAWWMDGTRSPKGPRRQAVWGQKIKDIERRRALQEMENERRREEEGRRRLAEMRRRMGCSDVNEDGEGFGSRVKGRWSKWGSDLGMRGSRREDAAEEEDEKYEQGKKGGRGDQDEEEEEEEEDMYGAEIAARIMTEDGNDIATSEGEGGERNYGQGGVGDGPRRGKGTSGGATRRIHEEWMGGWKHGVMGTIIEEEEKDDKEGVHSKSEANAPDGMHDTQSSSSPSSSTISSSSPQHRTEGASQEDCDETIHLDDLNKDHCLRIPKDRDETIQNLTRPLYGHSPTRGTLEDLLRKRKSVSCPLSTPFMPADIPFEVPFKIKGFFFLSNH